jgi:hypothetical protein
MSTTTLDRDKLAFFVVKVQIKVNIYWGMRSYKKLKRLRWAVLRIAQSYEKTPTCFLHLENAISYTLGRFEETIYLTSQDRKRMFKDALISI